MQNLLIPDKIIKCKRKSISLIIKNNGEFIVRAPISVCNASIIAFINEKSNWILKKRSESIKNAVQPLRFDNLEQIRILDSLYNLEISNANRVRVNNNVLTIPNVSSKQRLITYLKNYAKKYIFERVKLISELFNFEFSSISITSAKTCWGSCGFNNKLHFTYRLMMCPSEVVDYVVLHELCHTKVKNHSDKFWRLVASCNPYYKNHEKWLKQNRGLMDLI